MFPRRSVERFLCCAALLCAPAQAEQGSTECPSAAMADDAPDRVRLFRCRADALISEGLIPPARIERCHERSGALWGNRPGEREESLWHCLRRERDRATAGGDR